MQEEQLLIDHPDGRAALVGPAGDRVLKKIRKDGGFYEGRLLSYLTRMGLLEEDMVVVDAGAHIGNHTIFFSWACKKVIAFEPSRDSYAFLRRNIWENRLDNVETYNLALSAKPARLRLSLLSVIGDTGNRFWWYEGEEGGPEPARMQYFRRAEREVLCDSVPLDSFNFSSLDFLKIDVEGMELEVLDGAEKTIEEFLPLVMIEVLSSTAKPVEEWLQLRGYWKDTAWARRPGKCRTWLMRRPECP
jgi:FkbM family methyltransferase